MCIGVEEPRPTKFITTGNHVDILEVVNVEPELWQKVWEVYSFLLPIPGHWDPGLQTHVHPHCRFCSHWRFDQVRGQWLHQTGAHRLEHEGQGHQDHLPGLLHQECLPVQGRRFQKLEEQPRAPSLRDRGKDAGKYFQPEPSLAQLPQRTGGEAWSSHHQHSSEEHAAEGGGPWGIGFSVFRGEILQEYQQVVRFRKCKGRENKNFLLIRYGVQV